MANPSGIGALSAPSSFAPSEGAEISQAIGQYPQIMQAQQLQQTQQKDQLQDFAMKNAQRLAHIAVVNEAAATDPTWISEAHKYLSILGAGSLPVLPNGQVDTKKFMAMVTPPVPVTGAQLDNARTNFNKTVLDVESGKGTIDGIVTAAKSAQAVLGSEMDPYLDPSYLKSNVFGPMVEAQIAHLHDLGINISDNQAYREQALTDLNQRFQDKLGETTRLDTGKIDNWRANQQATSYRLSQADQRIQQSGVKLQQYIENSQSMLGVRAVNAYNAFAKPIIDDYKNTRSALDNVRRDIQSAHTANGAHAYIDPGLLSSAVSLQQHLNDLAPAVKQAQDNMQNLGARAASAITKQPVKPVAVPENAQQITMSMVQDLSKKYHKSVDQVVKDYEAAGYVVSK